jgi:hypothetical protein
MIDQKVMAAHQWVIDKSQRTPAWWDEHLAWAFGIFNAIAYILANSGNIQPFWLGIIVFASAGMFWISREPFLLSFVGSKDLIRWFFWVDFLTRTIQCAKDPTNWRAAYLLSAIVILLFLYFAACKPPHPRKHREATADNKDGPARRQSQA